MARSLNDLLIKYGEKPLSPSRTFSPRAKKTKKPSDSPSRVAPTATSRSQSVASETHRARRNIEGLYWTEVDGFDVLRTSWTPRHALFSNYIARPSVHPKGTYEILRLNPHGVIWRRIKAKDILSLIERSVRQDEEQAEHKRQFEQKLLDNELAEERRLANQPGFYIIPGEMIEDEDDDWCGKPSPIGPFERFDKAGILYGSDDGADYDEYPFAGDDVEDFAIAHAKSLLEERRKGSPQTSSLLPVKIIESRNRQSAAEGKGHIWWDDGVFKGPPVNPSQMKLGW